LDLSAGIDDYDLIQAVATALKLHTAEERESIENALFPAMLCAAAATGSVARMEGKHQAPILRSRALYKLTAQLVS
jgi:hypothetical protein